MAAQNLDTRLSENSQANHKTAESINLPMELLAAYLEKRDIPKYISTIRTATERAAKIVSSMLRFSRRSDSVMQPINLPDIIERAIEFAANDYDLRRHFDFRSIEIVRDYGKDIPKIPGVAVELEQVFLNLLKNASQAMSDNPPSRKPELKITISRDRGYVTALVKDNGCGMEENVRHRIFEPFFTTKMIGLGTGLGLSVAYMIITQNHKGLLEVSSTPKEGTVFMVRLPIV